MSSIPFDLSKIRAFVLDMDGVVSATVSPIGPDGMPMRTVNVKDGYAMQYAVKQGYTLAVISGGASEAMTQRFHQLGAKHVYMRVSDKAAQLDILCQEAGITPDQIARHPHHEARGSALRSCGCRSRSQVHRYLHLPL